jgi:hypothetical protein
MFTCKNPARPVHQHSLVIEAKQCWGLIPGFQAPTPPAPVAPAVRYATPRQIAFVKDLGGDEVRAQAMTISECSAYIDVLKKAPKETPVTATPAAPDPRLTMIEGLITMIPDGYYALQADSGDDITFMRLSRPKPTRSRPNPMQLKIQTQHGPRLEELAAQWPSGKWSFYKYSQGWTLDKLLLLCADHHTSAMRYAKELGKCCRCNCELTDPRSRHYGIGPECETKNGWGWVIDVVDSRHDGRSFETLLHLGLIDLS